MGVLLTGSVCVPVLLCVARVCSLHRLCVFVFPLILVFLPLFLFVSQSVALPFVSCLLVLDADGNRVAVKYWDPSLLTCKAGEELKAQLQFEKKVYSKTSRHIPRDGYELAPEVMILDSSVLVYKVVGDCIIYVGGSSAENELILQAVLQALDETIANLLKYETQHNTQRHCRLGCWWSVCLSLTDSLLACWCCCCCVFVSEVKCPRRPLLRIWICCCCPLMRSSMTV